MAKPCDSCSHTYLRTCAILSLQAFAVTTKKKEEKNKTPSSLTAPMVNTILSHDIIHQVGNEQKITCNNVTSYGILYLQTIRLLMLIQSSNYNIQKRKHIRTNKKGTKISKVKALNKRPPTVFFRQLDFQATEKFLKRESKN